MPKTRAFIWTVAHSELLPIKISQIIKKPENVILVSAVSFWEISIKSRIGKLNLGGILPEELMKIAEDMAKKKICQ